MKDFRTEKLQQALQRGELFEYMVGEKGYEYTNQYADVPTDDETVFISVKEYSKVTNDPLIWPAFQRAWVTMSANSNYSWFTLYYLYLYLRHFPDTNQQPIALAAILPLLTTNIQHNKESLSHDQRWMGRGLPQGLWDNVIQMANTINHKFNLSIKLN